MFVYLTDPVLEDYDTFHDLITEESVSRQFINYRSQSIDETRNEIKYWVENRNQMFPAFIKMIRVSKFDVGISDGQNSKLVGFISNVNAGSADYRISGFKMLMNFAIRKHYSGLGIMTAAVELAIEKLHELSFNIIPALVKPGNVAAERVLEKCGFDLVRDDGYGKIYVKAIKIDTQVYKSTFNL